LCEKTLAPERETVISVARTFAFRLTPDGETSVAASGGAGGEAPRPRDEVVTG